MSGEAPRESAEIDALDRQVIHGLQLDPRIPLRRLADVLGVSEQTVARRYRRLRSEGIVRVVGVVDPRPLGQVDWLVRVQSRPDGTGALAEALARRDDVAWVSITAGGSEVTCAVRSRTRRASDELIFERLPRTAHVLGLTALMVLHRFDRPGGFDDLINIGDVLSEQQKRDLKAEPPGGRGSARLEADDEPMVALLRRDGRATVAQLSQASGLSAGRVTRRLAQLQAGGTLYFDVDVATDPLGLSTMASLWLTVAPARLDEIGQALNRLPEVQFAAAISGPVNLTASVTCADVDALYAFVTTQVGALDGVRAVDVSPVLRRVKQAGALVSGTRLVNPKPL